jgi:hypothetical protein
MFELFIERSAEKSIMRSSRRSVDSTSWPSVTAKTAIDGDSKFVIPFNFAGIPILFEVTRVCIGGIHFPQGVWLDESNGLSLRL